MIGRSLCLPRRAWARLLAIGIVGLAALHAPRAIAGEAEARQEFGRGVRAYDAGEYPVALDAFRRAYVEKPSPGIQRNIALCLRAMHRDAEAVDTLEAMLASGGDAIDVHTREAARKAIDEMSESLATIRVRLILQAPDARTRDAAARGASSPRYRLSVDDTDVSNDTRAALRIDPGEHTLRARVDGFAEGMARITVSAGERDRLVEIPLVAIVSAPAPSASEDDIPPPPALYTPDTKLPPPPDPLAHRWIAAGGLTLGSESRTLVSGSGPTSAPFSSVGVTLRVGWKLSRFFNVEGLGEVGWLSAASTVSNGLSDLSVTTWSLAPELRFHTTGKVRFIVGAGAGIFGQHASWQTGANGGTSGSSGTDGIFLAEIGGQIELGRWLLELDGITDVHGVDRATASNGSGDLFTGGTARRTGVRATLGYTF